MNYFDVLFAKKLSGSSDIKIETLDVVANGTYSAPTGSAYGTVNVDVPSGSVEVDKKDVTFYDYDGTIVASYTKTEFLALSAMPDNPSHDGLTAQGWNWNLSDAKAHVTSNNRLNIGQMYITSDGKTRLYVHMEEGRLNPELNLTFVEAGSFTVDWGDGTTPDTVSGSANTLGTIVHTYAAAGDYVIAITVVSGKVSINNLTAFYSNLFKKVAGSDISGHDSAVYLNCIKKINVGNAINIGYNAFNNCHSLAAISIPNGVTSIDGYDFSNCHSLAAISIPNGVTSISYSDFSNCHSLTAISIPNGVTSIGNSAFNNCDSLTAISIPNGVTSIGTSAFNNCMGLGFIKFTSSTPPTVSNSNAFTGVPTDCIIYIPTGTLEDYEDATNYPDPDVYQYVEY